MRILTPAAIAFAAGSLTHASNASNPTQSIRPTISSSPVAHIYYNIATGEKISTSLNTTTHRDTTDPYTILWVADNETPCSAFGQSSGTSITIDNPNDYFGTGAVSETNTTLLDWADIARDTVIDCIQLAYGTAIQDTDTNSDGIGDGIEGFATLWAFYDTENGFNGCYRWGLVGFCLSGLAGSIDGAFAGYRLTVDLAGEFSDSRTFEIGDSDGDLQSAAHHNPFVYITDLDSDGSPDGDMDGDGLADFGYSVRFIQPGTIDVDDADGDDDFTTGIDGNPAIQDATSLPLAHYRGTTVETYNGNGTFSYEVTNDPGANAYGAEDGWDEYGDFGFYNGTYWAGGFSCNSDGNEGINAFGQIALTMYGPIIIEPCAADYTGEGTLDVFDVFAFLDLFNAGDLAADWSGGGLLDVFDVFLFLELFNAGCP